MMFNPDEIGSLTHEKFLGLFTVNCDHDEDEAPAPNDDCYYSVTITSMKQFTLTAKYLKSGLSFLQVNFVLNDTKDVLGMGSIGFCTETLVGKQVVGLA